MLILWSPTPNPDALKFTPEDRLTEGRGWSFRREHYAPGLSPLADGLFAIPDVERVYIGADFVTVTRGKSDAPWAELRGQIVMALAEHLASGAPHVAAAAPQDPSGTDVEAEIRQVIERFVQPAVSRDGGEIVLQRFDAASGVAWVRMEGACGGCPSSRQTLEATVDRTVRRYVPEVQAVMAEPEAASPSRRRRPSWWRKAWPKSPAEGAARTVFLHNGRAVSDRGELDQQ